VEPPYRKLVVELEKVKDELINSCGDSELTNP
jgi:hypothetical protein